ncbi:endonuclease domain-containing protein [Pseudonocardia nantongensis]|uniref:endonuclease domain-containing protein n=1 Tax=Pseudonocardia nantongensis TaxID=1181885 RepID=UPI00397A51AC
MTPRQLRGRAFTALFRGVFVASDVAVTYLVHCEAAALSFGVLVDSSPERRPGLPSASSSACSAALAGWAAAEMLGAACAPRRAPVEVLVVRGRRRAQPGLRVRHAQVPPAEIASGVRIPVPGRRRRFVPGRTVTTTSAVRAAFDLARVEDRVDAVIALDALSRIGGFAPAAVLDLATRHPGQRGAARLGGRIALASPLAESPMETRVRLALHDHGVRPPVLQHPVGEYRIDLAYPDLLLGIEYDGGHHLTPEQARDDLARQAFLTARGWEILRPEAHIVLHRPEYVAGLVRYRLARRDARFRRARDRNVHLAVREPGRSR